MNPYLNNQNVVPPRYKCPRLHEHHQISVFAHPHRTPSHSDLSSCRLTLKLRLVFCIAKTIEKETKHLSTTSNWKASDTFCKQQRSMTFRSEKMPRIQKNSLSTKQHLVPHADGFTGKKSKKGTVERSKTCEKRHARLVITTTLGVKKE